MRKTIKCFYSPFSYTDILAMMPEMYSGQVFNADPGDGENGPQTTPPEICTVNVFTPQGGGDDEERIFKIFDRFARMGGLKGPNSGGYDVSVHIPGDLDEPCTVEYSGSYGDDNGISIEFPMSEDDRRMIAESAGANFEAYWAPQG